MRQFLVIFFIFSFCVCCGQPKDVLKFDCKASVKERVNPNEKQYSEGYSLLIVDFYKSKIETYPDSIILNFIGGVEQRISNGFLIMDFKCIDKYNNSCKAHLMYSIKEDKAAAMKLEWDDWSVLYFIDKQTQFPIKQ